MDCRGKETRAKFVAEHTLFPVAYVQLLAGQNKISCTGDKLTDAYYCFTYVSNSSKKTGIILCGSFAADHFLQLIKHPRLPLFNPLSTQNGHSVAGSGASLQNINLKWGNAAEQLYNAINLVVICWSTPPGGPLLTIKQKIEQFRTKPPFPSQVKAINTIIGKDKANRKLSQMISDLEKNNDLKNYTFNHLDAILAAEGIFSNFT